MDVTFEISPVDAYKDTFKNTVAMVKFFAISTLDPRITQLSSTIKQVDTDSLNWDDVTQEKLKIWVVNNLTSHMVTNIKHQLEIITKNMHVPKESLALAYADSFPLN